MAAPYDPSADPRANPVADDFADELEEARAGSGSRMREAWAGLTPGRRRFVLAGIVMGVVATIIIVWFALAATVPKPQWKDISFTVPNDTEVQMRYMVTKPPEMTAECLLLAQETNHGVVGRMTVVLGPSTERTTVHEATIRTTSLAVIGTVRSCHEQ